MLPNKISVTTADFQQPLSRSFHLAMQAGAQGVQLDLRSEISQRDFGETARRQLLHQLRERDLQAASAHFPLRSPIADPDRLDERLDAVRKAIEFASQLRIRVLTLPTGRIPPADDREAWESFQGVLSDLAARGNRDGVLICLVPAGDPATGIQELITSVTTGPLAVDADLGAWVMHNQPPTAQLRELHALIGHVEIRDAVRNVGGSGKEVPVGRGEIDWDEIAALLGEIEYSGWLNVRRTSGDDRPGDIGRAIQYLRNLFPRGAEH